LKSPIRSHGPFPMCFVLLNKSHMKCLS
jgi:hypothetical protein